MKYMGSKRGMVANGLGEVLDDALNRNGRFADIFAGSGIVACHVAQKYSIPVFASDLQSFSAVLSNAVIARIAPVSVDDIWMPWKHRAEDYARQSGLLDKALVLDSKDWKGDPQELVDSARALSASSKSPDILRAYGGFYFSPLQALTIASLRATLPEQEPEKTVALASLIGGAMKCVAAPGHTAQPFKATPTGAPHLFNRWRMNAATSTFKELIDLAPRCAQVKGVASILDAEMALETLRPDDVAFVDPPYSGVQYSRFYHVLETISRDWCSPVDGEGRYPSRDERPSSDFSLRSKSTHSLDRLLMKLAAKRVLVVLTFPAGEASNGLSGERVEQISRKYFEVDKKVTTTVFSTLGGRRSSLQGTRQSKEELILILRPL